MRSNVRVADTEFGLVATPGSRHLNEEKLVELTSILYSRGAAQDVLDEWVEVLKEHDPDPADNLDPVEPAKVDQEAAKIAEYFDAE